MAFANETPKRPDLAELMSGFVSLGVNCELGLVQRHCNADQPTLLRFGYIPLPGLLDALTCRFEGIGDPAQLQLDLKPRREFDCTHARFGFDLHTRMLAPQYSEEQVRKRLTRHYVMLARLLMEQLAEAEKIFVVRAPKKDTDLAEADRTAAAIGTYGKAVLLWVACSDDPALAGTVHWRVPGQLMIGYLDRFTPLRRAAIASFDVWLQLCASAAALKAAQTMDCVGAV